VKTILSVVLSMCLLQAAPPQQNGKPPDPQPAPEPVALKQPLAFGLEDGTPVKLKLNRTISSADAHVNDTVDFEVLEQDPRLCQFALSALRPTDLRFPLEYS